MAAPFLDDPLVAKAAIIHNVRDPLASVSSFVLDMHFFADGPNDFAPFRDFALAHMPGVMHLPTEVERACLYWVQWHEMILRKAQGRRYLRFAIESKLTSGLLDFLGVPASAAGNAFHDDRINSWRRRERDLTLADIPDGEVKARFVALAAQLGYAALGPDDLDDGLDTTPSL